MELPVRQRKIADLAGIITWAIVSAITLYVMSFATDRFAGLWWPVTTLQLVYLAAMLVAAGSRNLPGGRTTRLLALAVQLLAALTLGWLLPLDFLPIYTIIWLAIAANLLSQRIAFGLFLVLMATWYCIQRWIWQDDAALIQILLFGAFHYFAMQSSIDARRADSAREDAQALNQELVATQHLLAEASRQGERTRIARDLHDLLGHHLTALTINLQVAGRLADGEAQSRIDKCHALSKLLLSDVREAVTTLREESAVDFTRALRLTVENIPRLQIDLDIDDGLEIDDVHVAESLLRCVQEAITNTLRHSRATHSWVRVWRENGRVNLRIRDNGVADSPLRWGNGLTGMRERIERIRGELSVRRVRQAIQIDIHIPVPA